MSGEATQYVLDLAAALPVVISDTEAVYLYGLDIIAQQQSERQYYVHDGLGSVRQLLDNTGDLETTYAYDPFGVPVVGGDTSNPYRFTGEAWDDEVELLYLRARYYQPEVGRFVSKDPWEGNLLSPATLNLYVYARNNPLNLVDPSGLQICGSFLCQPQVVDPDPELRRMAEGLQTDFRIIVGTGWHPEAYEPYYVLWSSCSKEQLELVRQAAIDFAMHMQGGPAHFRRKVGPVPLYKREGDLAIPSLGRVGGWTMFTSVTLPGNSWDWERKGGASMKATIVHEMAHFWDVGFGNEGGRLSSEMASGFWTSQLADCQVRREERGSMVPRVTVRDWRVGRKRQWLNPAEDWADSVEAYVYPEYATGDEELEISKSRWYFVAQQMNPGNPDRFAYPEEWGDIPFADTLFKKTIPSDERHG